MKSEKSVQELEQTNLWLEEFFKKILPGKTSLLVMNPYFPENPNIIYEHNKCLSLYVTDDNELRFTDCPDKAKTVYSIKLCDNPEYDIEKVLHWFTTCEHRKMWKVMVSNSNPQLFLSGYNFLNRKKKEGQYPVFSKFNSKLYFQQSKAEEVSATLRKEGYSVVSC